MSEVTEKFIIKSSKGTFLEIVNGNIQWVKEADKSTEFASKEVAEAYIAKMKLQGTTVVSSGKNQPVAGEEENKEDEKDADEGNDEEKKEDETKKGKASKSDATKTDTKKDTSKIRAPKPGHVFVTTVDGKDEEMTLAQYHSRYR